MKIKNLSIEKFICFIIFAAALLNHCISVSADAVTFNNLLEQLKNDEIIPRERGKIISFGDFEDEFGTMGKYQWFPIANADNFVISADIAWLASLSAANVTISGCGIVFGADPDSKDNLLASVRMDGHVYLSGNKSGTPLRFIDYFFAYPAIQGEVNFALVINGDKATTYINGERLGTLRGFSIYGNAIGLASLSGSNYEFGTRCTWKDIYFYTW